MVNKIILITILNFITQITFSQEINLHIKDIKEERHLEQKDSYIELTSIIQGVKVDDLNLVKIKEITSAVDDKGNVLKKLESFFGDEYSSNNSLKIKLEAPVRNSSKISSIQGIIKHYSPSESNDSKLTFNNPLDYYNKNLLKKKYSDIRLTLIDKDALKKLKEDDDKKYQKAIEDLKKEGAFGEGTAEIVNVFKGFFEGLTSFGSNKESLSFYIEDEEEKIVEIFIYNGKGKKMNYGSSRMGKSRLTINLKEKIESDWKIEVLIENKKSLKEYKFNLTDVTLP